MNVKTFIKRPSNVIIALAAHNLLKISDEKYLKMLYKHKLKKELNLECPKTFNEKMQWLKLYNRNPEYTKMVDKYEVREYIKEMIGEKYLIPLIGIYENFDEIKFESLPNQFVMKCTHDFGSVIICKDKANFNIKAAKKRINKCQKINFYFMGREWPYKNVKPRIIIEKYMEDESLNELKDYKVFNFNGEPKLIQVDSNRFSKHKRNMYTTNWEKLNMNLRCDITDDMEIKKPTKLNEMLEISKALAKNTPFMRTDFYVVNDKIYFGEITFFPASGFGKFIPDEYDMILGDMIELPKEKRVGK